MEKKKFRRQFNFMCPLSSVWKYDLYDHDWSLVNEICDTNSVITTDIDQGIES